MTNPLQPNKEQQEAEQQDVNQSLTTFIDSLPKKEREKFKAVIHAVETLTKADVAFYLFPSLPISSIKGKEQVWQWNSLTAISKYDENDKYTKESREENGRYHQAFFCMLFNQFSNFFEGNTIDEKLGNMPRFFAYCLLSHQKYLNEGSKKEDNHES